MPGEGNNEKEGRKGKEKGRRIERERVRKGVREGRLEIGRGERTWNKERGERRRGGWGREGG